MPSQPTHCPDGCTNRPERWEYRESSKHSGRDIVRCKVCHKWVGYLPHWRKLEIERGKLRRSKFEQSEIIDADSVPALKLQQQTLFQKD